MNQVGILFLLRNPAVVFADDVQIVRWKLLANQLTSFGFFAAVQHAPATGFFDFPTVCFTFARPTVNPAFLSWITGRRLTLPAFTLFSLTLLLFVLILCFFQQTINCINGLSLTLLHSFARTPQIQLPSGIGHESRHVA